LSLGPPTALHGTPQAEVGFRVGAQNHSVLWRQGGTADSRLTAISVFDSRTAAVHVDETNDLAYTPLPLRIMAALAETCKEIKDKLATEIRVIENQTPAIVKNPECAPDTEVGKLLSGLSAKTTDAKVEELSGLSETEGARLKTLSADLANCQTASNIYHYLRIFFPNIKIFLYLITIIYRYMLENIDASIW
jgi:hypothetical protein